MNNIDEYLNNLRIDDVKVPSQITNTIKNTLSIDYKEKTNNFTNIFKYVACFAVILISSMGITFAKDIKKFVQQIFFDNGKGISEAMENNYYELYNDVTSESNGVNVNIGYVVMDDNFLGITFNFKFDKVHQELEYNRIYIPDMIIMDNEQNILFSDTYTEKCCIHGGYSISEPEKDGENTKISYSMQSGENETFPNSKELYIKFNKIIFGKSFNSISSDEKIGKSEDEIIKRLTIDTIEGNWKIKMNLPEKFYNRNNSKYKFANKYDHLILNKANLTNTNFEFEIQTDEKDILNNINIDKSKYIENEKNEIFNTNSDGLKIENNGKIIYTAKFDLTSFNATNKLKIYIPLTDGSNKIIELEKE